MDKSQDRLRRASGETEDEISSTNEKQESRPDTTQPVRTVTEQVAMEVIIQLETFTGRELTQSETELWKRRIMGYPYWKLAKTADYTGGLNNEYFKWLDSLRKPEEKPAYLRSLPEPRTDTAKRTCAYLGVMDSPATKEVKKQKQEEWIAYMRSRGFYFVNAEECLPKFMRNKNETKD